MGNGEIGDDIRTQIDDAIPLYKKINKYKKAHNFLKKTKYNIEARFTKFSIDKIMSQDAKTIRKNCYLISRQIVIYLDKTKKIKVENLFIRYTSHFKHILMILIAILVISSTSYTTGENQKIVSYDKNILSKLLKHIDKYAPLITESEFNPEKITKTETSTDYLEKPEILKTTKSYTYNNSSRDIIARDTNRMNDSNGNAYINNSQNVNTYWRGFCTWYAKKMRPDIPNNWGNANAWLISAKKDSWQTGENPHVGAIIVTNESWTGHVGYVEKVDGDQIIISEMNKIGWNRISSRALNKDNKIIKGYIY